MPYDTNGNYSLPTIYYAISGTVINPSQHNTPFEDVQAALNRPLLRDGTAPMTGNLNANGNKITGMAKGTADTDAVTFAQLGDYATQSWSEDRYVRSPLNPSLDNRVSSIGVSKSIGKVYASVDGGQLMWLQPSGDYATNPALSAEESSRANADSNLKNQVNNRVVKTGDTMTGSLNINTPGGGVIASGNGGGDNVHGGAAYSAGFTSSYNVGSVAQAIYRFINVNGVGPFATIWLTDNYGGFHELRYGADDRLRTASGNVFALTSEVITQSHYANDFATSDSRVINLPYGHRIVSFWVSNVSDQQRISYPQAFSAAAYSISVQQQSVNAQNYSATPYDHDAGGFTIHTGGNGLSFWITAIGPR